MELKEEYYLKVQPVCEYVCACVCVRVCVCVCVRACTVQEHGCDSGNVSVSKWLFVSRNPSAVSECWVFPWHRGVAVQREPITHTSMKCNEYWMSGDSISVNELFTLNIMDGYRLNSSAFSSQLMIHFGIAIWVFGYQFISTSNLTNKCKQHSDQCRVTRRPCTSQDQWRWQSCL